MEIKENIEEFQKGFNEGYLLAKHNYKLADKIAEALKDSERGQGFKEGCNQFSKEKEKPKIILPSWLKGYSGKSVTKEKTKDVDKDFMDKE